MSREQDARVAELVMGWRLVNGRAGAMWKSPTMSVASHGQEPPRYTTDPACDYQVLEHVREKWSQSQVCAVRDELALAWSRRASEQDKRATSVSDFAVHGCTQYEPGDFALAALAVIEKEQADA